MIIDYIVMRNASQISMLNIDQFKFVSFILFLRCIALHFAIQRSLFRFVCMLYDAWCMMHMEQLVESQSFNIQHEYHKSHKSNHLLLLFFFFCFFHFCVWILLLYHLAVAYSHICNNLIWMSIAHTTNEWWHLKQNQINKSQLSTYQINCRIWNGHPLSAKRWALNAENSKHFKQKEKLLFCFFFLLLSFCSKWHLLLFALFMHNLNEFAVLTAKDSNRNGTKRNGEREQKQSNPTQWWSDAFDDRFFFCLLRTSDKYFALRYSFWATMRTTKLSSMVKLLNCIRFQHRTWLARFSVWFECYATLNN